MQTFARPDFRWWGFHDGPQASLSAPSLWSRGPSSIRKRPHGSVALIGAWCRMSRLKPVREPTSYVLAGMPASQSASRSQPRSSVAGEGSQLVRFPERDTLSGHQ